MSAATFRHAAVESNESAMRAMQTLTVCMLAANVVIWTYVAWLVLR